MLYLNILLRSDKNTAIYLIDDHVYLRKDIYIKIKYGNGEGYLSIT
jgi:hypothetical protein